VDVGQRTEAIVLPELVKLGHRVLVPFGVNHRYDFAIDLGDRFLRLQCKTARLLGGRILFNAQSIRSNTQRVYLRSYFGEIDYFAVYSPDIDRVYAVPVDEAGRCSGSLRVEPTANGQSKGVRWADDYLLERQLSPA
jgi:PD-(D/E)XK endonuclease